MLFITIGSLATAGSFIFILYSLSPKLLKLILGYRVWLDIVMSLGLTVMAISTGTISGLVIGSLSAIVMTISLVIMKKCYGYSRYEKDPITGKRSLVTYNSSISADSIGSQIKVFSTNCMSFGQRLVASFTTKAA